MVSGMATKKVTVTLPEAQLERIRALLKIEWTYELPQDGSSGATGRIPSDIKSPPSGYIDDLLKLGQIGHVRGIQDKLLEIESELPQHQAFVARMRDIVSSFDLKRYMTVLEALRGDDAR